MKNSSRVKAWSPVIPCLTPAALLYAFLGAKKSNGVSSNILSLSQDMIKGKVKAAKINVLTILYFFVKS